MRLYRNNLKNREFGKEVPQNCDSERETIGQGQGSSENHNSETKPTPPKPDSLGYFGVVFLLLIRAYQLALSPFLGPCCRFYPSCSEYAIEAIQKHGSGKGVWLTLKRLVKCHPWHSGGHDPVP